MARQTPYSYSDAGYNGFFRRTLGSNPDQMLLQTGGSNKQQLNFDDMQVSGSLGDKLRVGSIVVDGKTGRIFFEDETGQETMRLGNVDA